MANSRLYYVVDGWGDSVDSPTVEEIQTFLDRLDIDDPEHCEVWLSHAELDWTLSCLPNNEVSLNINADDGQYIECRHLTNVSREKMLMLWQTLAGGKIEDLEKESWLPGYTSEPPPPKPDPKDIHRGFWDKLITAERISGAKCKIEEC